MRNSTSSGSSARAVHDVIPLLPLTARRPVGKDGKPSKAVRVMAQWYGELHSTVSRCTHGLAWKACDVCRSWRLRAWRVGQELQGPEAKPPRVARTPRSERGPTVHGLDRKSPPPTSADSKRVKRAARKADAQAAFRRLAGLPDPEPIPEPIARPASRPASVPRPPTPTPAQPRIARAVSQTATALPQRAASRHLTKRPWSTARLVAAVTEGWFERDALALFMYMDSRDLVLDFKDGHPDAVAEVLAWFRGTMGGLSRELRTRGCRYIVATPRHTVGPARASAEELCARLAAQLPALEHLPGALVRTRAVTSGYPDGQRSTEARHMATIRYAGPDLGPHPGGTILFDDVYTSGATSRACRSVIARATGAASVLSLFITKTSARRSWQPDLGVVRRYR